MQITVTISNAQAAGLRYVLRRRNSAITVPEGEQLESQPGYIPSIEAYLQQVVVDGVLDSYVKSMPVLSRRQVFAGLRSLDMLTAVEALVATQSAEVQQEWAETDSFARGNPMLNAAWPLLPANAGKTAEELAAELDDLFDAFAAL